MNTSLVRFLFVVIALTSITSSGRTNKKRSFDWALFLEALERVEAPKTEAQAQAAIKREGAYGVLQIRQICLDDVNRKYGTTVTLKDVQSSRAMSRWVCVHYVRMYSAGSSYEVAARTWNGGPSGRNKKSTITYWHRVKAALSETALP